MKRYFVLFFLAVFLPSCAQPVETTKTLDERPSIGFDNVPQTAEIFVDDLSMGIVGDYDGKSRSLILVNGRHKVKLIHDGQEILSQEIYLRGPSVTILRP
ncbi:hypothetical protein O4H49_00090 [Kiloniella laminariae]|uniref:PEGA domain-containing protein n=1 Tax=Kiloniella laminariae TaxID=454162 RepID=A0ABT4LDI5_9PROT|nr:hypothetical protein [Kiloniella laminariae]MCZ4279152.1 hypothetical protein [Kiloniella laminariae]